MANASVIGYKVDALLRTTVMSRKEMFSIAWQHEANCRLDQIWDITFVQRHYQGLAQRSLFDSEFTTAWTDEFPRE